MLDAAALNAFALFKLKNPYAEKATLRRLLIEQLATELIKPCASDRLEGLKENKFHGIYSLLIMSFKRLGFNFNILNSPEKKQKNTKKRCTHFECKVMKNDTKYSNICLHCSQHYCNKHCEKLPITVICKECIIND